MLVCIVMLLGFHAQFGSGSRQTRAAQDILVSFKGKSLQSWEEVGCRGLRCLDEGDSLQIFCSDVGLLIVPAQNWICHGLGRSKVGQ
jgi:hypothetical protein